MREATAGGDGLGVVKIDVLEAAPQQVILLQRVLEQRDLVGQIQLLLGADTLALVSSYARDR